MPLTRAEQRETLYAAALSAGLRVARRDIAWRDRSVRVEGLRLHFLDWGTRGKPPVLLLHGGMQTAHSWDLVAVVLRRQFHVVAMDLRGHGDSDWVREGDYGHASHRKDIAGVVRELGWDKCIVVGVSLGGLAALDYAAQHPEQTAALVVVDVGPELNTGGVGRIVDFGRGPAELDSIEDFIERAMEYNPRRKREQLRHSLTHNLRQLPNGKWTWKYDRRLTHRPRETDDAGQAGVGARHTRFTEMWDTLGRIECPTLVVRGADSDVFAEETARKMVDLIPDSRFVTVPDAGHTVPQDNPIDFLAALQSFLSELGQLS